MAKKPLKIEFAFGLESGNVLFVMAGCLTEALRKIANSPKGAWEDRRKVASGITMRLALSDADSIIPSHLRWWTVFEDTNTACVLDGRQYPGNQRAPDRYWLTRMGAWKWGLAPELYGHAPQHFLDAVIAAEELA